MSLSSEIMKLSHDVAAESRKAGRANPDVNDIFNATKRSYDNLITLGNAAKQLKRRDLQNLVLRINRDLKTLNLELTKAWEDAN